MPRSVPSFGRFELSANLGPANGEIVLHVYRRGKRAAKDSNVVGYFSVDIGDRLRLLSGRLLKGGAGGRRFVAGPGLMRQVRGRSVWTPLWRFRDRKLQLLVQAEVERLLLESGVVLEDAPALAANAAPEPAGRPRRRSKKRNDEPDVNVDDAPSGEGRAETTAQDTRAESAPPA